MAIKVRATAPGFYGRYRDLGNEFEIKEAKHFSKAWMEFVSDEAGLKKKSKPKKEEVDRSSDSAFDDDVI